MSIIRNISNTLSSMLITTTKVADTAGQAVDVATSYVDHRAKKFKIIDQQQIRTETAEEMAVLQERLDADQKVADYYNKLEGMFD